MNIESMRMETINISLPAELAEYVRHSVKGAYGNVSEFFRELIRQRREAEIAADVKALEEAHAGAFEREITPEELDLILKVQKEVRAEMIAEKIAAQKPAT